MHFNVICHYGPLHMYTTGSPFITVQILSLCTFNMFTKYIKQSFFLLPVFIFQAWFCLFIWKGRFLLWLKFELEYKNIFLIILLLDQIYEYIYVACWKKIVVIVQDDMHIQKYVVGTTLKYYKRKISFI